MASSNSVNYDETRGEIIPDALVLVGAIEAGESPSAADSAYAARQLNRMVKSWMVNGPQLWKRREAYLFTEKSKARYQLGPNSSDHSAEIDDVAVTELDADASSGDGTITVASTTGIALSDNIGVVLDDDTIDWFTVSSISGSDITLSETLSGDATDGRTVFAYTTAIDRPLRVIDAQRRDEDDNDTPIITISHEEYQRLPNKTITGKTNQVYYQPEIPDGFIYLWPEPETASDRIRMTCYFPIEDFDASSDNPDFPVEWLDALTWNLAARLIPSYGIPPQQAQEIRNEAASLYAGLLMWDQEPESVFFQPNMTHAHGG